MRVIYNGYAATTYGKASLSVTDREGREIYHTDNRNDELCDEKGLKDIIKIALKGGKIDVSNGD